MRVRNQRVVVFEATGSFASACVEALLALGAHVVAADPLRTQLETLSARVRHHERLYTAECVTESAAGAADLLRSVARRGPIDSVLLPADEGVDWEPALLALRSVLGAEAAGDTTGGAAATVVGSAPRLILACTSHVGASIPNDREHLPPPASPVEVLRYDPTHPADGVKALLFMLSETNKE